MRIGIIKVPEDRAEKNIIRRCSCFQGWKSTEGKSRSVSPLRVRIYAGLAQLVERVICNLEAVGSNPSSSSSQLRWLTKKHNHKGE